MDKDDVARGAEGLSPLEREWLTGWQGVAGAAYNCVATDLLRKGLLIGLTDWNLNAKGEAVLAHLQAKDQSYAE